MTTYVLTEDDVADLHGYVEEAERLADHAHFCDDPVREARAMGLADGLAILLATYTTNEEMTR